MKGVIKFSFPSQDEAGEGITWLCRIKAVLIEELPAIQIKAEVIRPLDQVESGIRTSISYIQTFSTIEERDMRLQNISFAYIQDLIKNIQVPNVKVKIG